ncbi:MAG: hypothetical protein N2645_09460 [Clostridia bacterium]|nr:hypothetical protein [Clostridia bacterium]
MNVERMLWDYNEIPKVIARLNSGLNQIIKDKEKIYEKMKAGSLKNTKEDKKEISPTLTAVEKFADKYIAYIEYVAQRINELVLAKELLDNAIQNLNIEENRILELFYFQKNSWHKVVELTKKPDQQCQRILQSALRKLDAQVKHKKENLYKMA